MSLNKESSRRHWMFGLLALSAAATTGCGAPPEDSTQFPSFDASHSAQSSDAPLATDKADAEASPHKKK